jgi:hypothetical protein
MFKRPILMGGPIVESALDDTGPHLFRDLDRAIAAEGIQHDNIVGPFHRVDAIGNIAFFVQRENEN